MSLLNPSASLGEYSRVLHNNNSNNPNSQHGAFISYYTRSFGIRFSRHVCVAFVGSSEKLVILKAQYSV